MIYSSAISNEFHWHPWFAWWPVRITGTNLKVALEKIERRKVVGKWVRWEYRIISADHDAKETK